MTDAQAAKLLRMSVRNLADLRGQGILPKAGSEADAYLDAYIPWLREAKRHGAPRAEKVDLETQRARLASEQADQVEMKNAIMRRDWAPIAGLRNAMIGQVEVMKSKLARVPAKVAPADPKLKARIASAIEDCLIDLSAERAVEEATGDAETGGDEDED